MLGEQKAHDSQTPQFRQRWYAVERVQSVILQKQRSQAGVWFQIGHSKEAPVVAVERLVELRRCIQLVFFTYCPQGGACHLHGE